MSSAALSWETGRIYHLPDPLNRDSQRAGAVAQCRVGPTPAPPGAFSINRASGAPHAWSPKFKPWLDPGLSQAWLLSQLPLYPGAAVNRPSQYTTLRSVML